MIVDFVAFVFAAVGVVLTGFVIGAVVEAVLVPGGLRELGPFNVVREEFEGFGIHKEDFLPVTAAAGNGVGHILSVMGEVAALEGHGAVF